MGKGVFSTGGLWTAGTTPHSCGCSAEWVARLDVGQGWDTWHVTWDHALRAASRDARSICPHECRVAHVERCRSVLVGVLTVALPRCLCPFRRWRWAAGTPWLWSTERKQARASLQRQVLNAVCVAVPWRWWTERKQDRASLKHVRHQTQCPQLRLGAGRVSTGDWARGDWGGSEAGRRVKGQGYAVGP